MTAPTITNKRNPYAILSELRAIHVRTERDEEFRRHLDRLLRRDGNGVLIGEPIRFTGTEETRGIVIIDGPGGGKTELVDYGLKKHPALQTVADDGRPKYLSVRVPNPATLKSVGLEILRASGYADISDRRERWSIWDIVRKRLALLGTVVLWIDEAHDLFNSVNSRETEDILNTLKSPMQGAGSVIVILSGIKRLWTLAETDSQLKRRFTMFKLPSITMAGDGKTLSELTSEFCKRADLQPPKDDDLVLRLIHASRGRFGRCIENIINAIESALLNNQRKLDIQNFAEVYAMSEGCNPAANIFLAKNWGDIRPDGSIAYRKNARNSI
jgi:hypothetical protein